MSAISYIELNGNFTQRDPYGDIIEFLKHCNARIDYDGVIIGNREDEDGWVCCVIKIDNDDPFEIALDNLRNEYIVSINATFEFDGEEHLFSFSIQGHNTLHVDIVGNRKTVDGYYTDFSWYFVNLVSRLRRSNIVSGSISYRDLC
jgi:hypothetical protein